MVRSYRPKFRLIKRYIYDISSFLLRRLRRTTINGRMISIEDKVVTYDTYMRTTMPQHILWEIGWQDAQWHTEPDPNYKNNPAYMRGWIESTLG